MTIRIVLLIKLLVLISQVQAQQLFLLSNVRVVDESGITQTEFRNIDLRQADALALQYLTDRGHFSARIDSASHKDAETILYTRPGPVFSFLITIVDSTDSLLSHRSGDAYSTVLLERVVADRLHDLHATGFPRATLIVESLLPNFENASISVSIREVTGERVLVDRLLFRGSEQLSAFYLLREAGFKSGEVFSPDRAEHYRRRIASSPFILHARQPVLRNTSEGWAYVMDVEEIRGSSLDLLLGYNPSLGGGRSIIGRGGLELRNFITEGSSGELEFERLPGSQSRLLASYNQYWVAGLPIMVGASAHLFQRDSTWFSTGVSLTGAYQSQSGYLYGLQGLLTTIQSAAQTQGVVRARYTGIRAYMEYRDTDNRFAPTSGSLFYLGVDQGRKVLDNAAERQLPGNIGITRFTGRYQSFFTISARQVATPRIHVGFSSAEVYFEDDLFRLGGHRDMRGYREEQLLAISYAWSDLEYRFLLDEDSYVFVFGAGGLYEYTSDLAYLNFRRDRKPLYAGGFGISYRVAPGVITFSYAVSPDDKISNGKVHFGIRNRF